MRAGGFRVSMRWNAHRLVEVGLRSVRGGPCVVRYGKHHRVSLRIRPGRSIGWART